MADEPPRDTEPPQGPPDRGRRARKPPTIDLEASRVEPAPAQPANEAAADSATDPAPEAAPAAAPNDGARTTRGAERIATAGIGAVAGAVAGLVVVAAAWMLLNRAPVLDVPTIATLETLRARLTRLEAPAPAARPDPALTARLDAADKAVAALRDELQAVRKQEESLGQALDTLKSTAPTPAPASAAEPAAVDPRLAELEAALKTVSDDVARLRDAQASAAQVASASAESAKAAVAEDPILRRAIVALALDQAVRQGGPFAVELAAARKTGGDEAMLAPLAPFADKGLPDSAALGRDVAAELERLGPPPAPEQVQGGWFERLKAGAIRLARIRRVDAPDPDAETAALARVAADARGDDLAAANRDAAGLPEAARAKLQPWREATAARSAALAASHRFVTDAVAPLSKPPAP